MYPKMISNELFACLNTVRSVGFQLMEHIRIALNRQNRISFVDNMLERVKNNIIASKNTWIIASWKITSRISGYKSVALYWRSTL